MRDSDRELIEMWRLGYSEGNASFLLDALALCFDKQYPIPGWVREGLLTAIERVSAGDASNWDQVFGSAKSRKTKRLKLRMANQVAKAIKDGGPKRTIIFELIGPRLKPPITGGLAKALYYEHFPQDTRDVIHPRRKSSKKLR